MIRLEIFTESNFQLTPGDFPTTKLEGENPFFI